MSIADTIRRLREDSGYSQERLADLLEVNRSAIAHWESGRTLPRMGNVRRLAEIFGIKVSDILDGDVPSSHAFVNLRPLGHVHAGPFSDEDNTDETTIEVPSSVLERHPNAFAVLVEGDCMNRIAPEGMAVVVDPDLMPTNGKAVVVETEDHQALIRRWYQGENTLMLVADSTEHFDDIVLVGNAPIRVIGTVVWVQSPHELEE